MKKLHLFCLSLALITICEFDKVLGSLEAQKEVICQRVTSSGFGAVLRDTGEQLLIRQIAEGFLQRVLAYYHIQPEQIPQRMYEDTLHELTYYWLTDHLAGGLSFCGEPLPEIVSKTIERCYNNRNQKGSLNITGFHNYLLFKLILNYGANALQEGGRGGLTLLHFAVTGGRLQLFRKLLKKGANVDAQDAHGNTPLVHAVEGELAIVRALWHAGACFDIPNHTESTALDRAYACLKSDIVMYLLALGVYVSGIQHDKIVRGFPNIDLCAEIKKQGNKITQELYEYAQDNRFQLSQDAARLITSFVVSYLEERAVVQEDHQSASRSLQSHSSFIAWE